MDTPAYGKWQLAGAVLGAVYARQTATADLIAHDLNIAPALASTVCRDLCEQGLLETQERTVGNRVHASYRAVDASAASSMVRGFEVDLPIERADDLIQRTIAWLQEQGTGTPAGGYRMRVRIVFALVSAAAREE